MNRLLFILFCIAALLSYGVPASASNILQGPDTVYTNQPLPNAALLTNIHRRYTMLIYASHTYKSIKLLDQQVKINGDRLTIVQKLYDGSSVNTDSVIVNRQTLAPVESYSDIPTSRDSFVYNANKITGTMTSIAGGKKGLVTSIDTLLNKPMFNGLTYAVTYQALSYKSGLPYYIAQYVPGRRVNFERVEYLKDDEITVGGIKVPAKLLEIKKTATITIHCWLDTKSQEVLKIEGTFPGFTYELLRA